MIKTIVFLIIITLFCLIGAESGVDKSKLSLDRLFSNEFEAEGFGPARWLKSGQGYSTLEKSSTKKGRDLVAYNPSTGKRKILVSAKELIPDGMKIPIKIRDYSWSDDGKWLAVFTNAKRVWRQFSRGDYWIFNMNTRKLKLIGRDAKSSTLQFAKFSPDSKKIAYVRERNLYVESLDGKDFYKLTSDGSSNIINGTFDWVYEEEFFLRDGFRWSPDSSKLAYWQLDTKGVKDFYLINNTDGLYSKPIAIQYPKAGTTNSASKVGVVSAKGGKTIWFNFPGDSRQHYIARMDWAAGSKEVIIQRLNRLQNTNWVVLGSAVTGKTRTVFIEKDKAWLDVDDDLIWYKNGRYFTWISERDGWRRLYVVNRKNGKMRKVTKGNFDIISIVSIDVKKGWVYYIASPKDPGQRYLYRTKLNGKGKPQLLSKYKKGTHSYQISPRNLWAIHTWSAFGKPGITDLVKLPGHKVVKVLSSNEKLRKNIHQLKKSLPEFFRIETEDKIVLDGWCIKPPEFDSKKKYPVLFFVYGEPWNQTVLDRWGRRDYIWHLMLAQQGYVVMSLDNRGTPAPRGREWRKSVYRQVGVLASQDQAGGVRALIKKHQWIDPERIAIWGWSGGGSMTLNALLRYPDLYKTGMAIAPVTDMRYYDTIYQERYMGLPDDNKEGYKLGSPITFAKNLKGNLLIVHGTGDDNVHYQCTEAIINKFIEFNKKFTMMAYPNRAHSIREGKNTTRHLFELLTNYLNENMPVDKK